MKLFKPTYSIFRLILNYIQNHYIKVRQLSAGEFLIEVNTTVENNSWTCKPILLLENIKYSKQLYKIERVIYE